MTNTTTIPNPIGESVPRVDTMDKITGATITIIPINILYLFFQRWFVEGISTVGIRG